MSDYGKQSNTLDQGQIFRSVYDKFQKTLRVSDIETDRKQVRWENNTELSAGTLDGTLEVAGSGLDAVVQLKSKADNSSNVTFTSSANYDFDSGDIQITAGKAQLKEVGGATADYDFSSSGDYTYSGNIEVTGGAAQLVLPTSSLNTSIEAFWKMNEASGTRVDSKGSNNLASTNSVGSAAGIISNACQFTADDQKLSIADNASLSFGNENFTLAFWLYLDSSSASSWILGKARSGKEYSVYITSGNTLRFIVTHNGSTDSFVTESSVGVLSTGTWYFVVAWHDADTDTLTIRVNDGTTNSSAHSVGVYQGPSDFEIGTALATYGGKNLRGRVDIVGVWRRLLTSGEITTLYNSGSAIELFSTYSTANDTIEPNTGLVYASTLTTFTETSTKNGNDEIKYIVSTDNGSTWEYWNGASWVSSDETYTQSNTAAEVNTNIGALPTSGTFLWRAFLHSDDGSTTPQLENVLVEASPVYQIGDFEIEMNFDIDPTTIIGWTTFTETVTKPTNTAILYKYSTDSGSSYNGTWLTAAQVQTAIQAIVSPDKIRFKAQLSTTVNNATPFLDNLLVESSQGFETNGTLLSNVYNSNVYDLSWRDVSIDTNVPEGTSVTVSVRAGDTSLETLAADFTDVTDGDVAGITGRFFQWKAVFVGTSSVRPNLNYFKIRHVTNEYQTVPGV